jgi:hypothetical protein
MNIALRGAVAPLLRCPARRKQIVLANAQQLIVGAGCPDHRARVNGGDHAALESPLWQIVQAQVPEGQKKAIGHG